MPVAGNGVHGGIQVYLGRVCTGSGMQGEAISLSPQVQGAQPHKPAAGDSERSIRGTDQPRRPPGTVLEQILI